MASLPFNQTGSMNDTMLLAIIQKMQIAESRCLIKSFCNYVPNNLMSQFYQLKVCNYAVINIIFLLSNLMSPDILQSFAMEPDRS